MGTGMSPPESPQHPSNPPIGGAHLPCHPRGISIQGHHHFIITSPEGPCGADWPPFPGWKDAEASRRLCLWVWRQRHHREQLRLLRALKVPALTKRPPCNLTLALPGSDSNCHKEAVLRGVEGLGPGGTGYARQASARTWRVPYHSAARAESVTASTRERKADSASLGRAVGTGRVAGQARPAKGHLSSRAGARLPRTHSTGTAIRSARR